VQADLHNRSSNRSSLQHMFVHSQGAVASRGTRLTRQAINFTASLWVAAQHIDPPGGCSMCLAWAEPCWMGRGCHLCVLAALVVYCSVDTVCVTLAHAYATAGDKGAGAGGDSSCWFAGRPQVSGYR
jgi:hypothetical protein